MFWDVAPLLADPAAQPGYRFLGCCAHRRFVCQLRYDSVSKLLFSVADDGLVCAWNPEAIDPANPHSRAPLSERELGVFALPHASPAQRDNPVLFCDLSWDGRFLATGAADGVVRVWRIPAVQRNRAGMTQQVGARAAFHAAAERTGGGPAGADAARPREGRGNGGLRASQLRPGDGVGDGGKRLSVAVQRGFRGVREDGAARRHQWECARGSSVDFSKSRSRVKLSCCVWSPDDRFVVTSSWLKRTEKKKSVFDVDIKVWNAQNGTIEFILNRDETPAITAPIIKMHFHPEFPSILVTSCRSGNLCFWDLKTRSLLHK